MDVEFSKVYEPEKIEKQANEIWLSGRHFHAEPIADGEDAKAYTIVIPPPNVTAPLHVGHALNNTLQDILIRFRRMQQFRTLWMPGTDHAGIATQTVVEKRILSEEGKKRTDFEREEFVARVQAWKDEYEARIIEQLGAMGCSCDWDRTRFTMDETCAQAVRENFFRLFRDVLIYRGKRLVNWDPATQTVLADDEVEHETVQGHFWYLQYPLGKPIEAGGLQIEHVTVATTRPETMLGDTAVAMNPRDPRAEALVGKMVRLPIVGRMIPIIADEHVVLPDPDSEDEKAKFSTGFLKVTPAHDPDDWAIGERHDLPVINVMAPDGSISDKHGWEDATEPEAQNLLGMDRFEAREAIVEWFRTENLLEEVREYTHEIGHSYRSHVPIEPYLSDQWYIAVKKPIEHLAEKFGEGLIEGTDVPANSLAGLALKPLLDGRLKFIPERYAKTYQNWLENLRDWPISRQLWWGHRIPAWRVITNFDWSSLNGTDFTSEFKSHISDFKNAMKRFVVKADLEAELKIIKPQDKDCFYLCVSTKKANESLQTLAEFIESWKSNNDRPVDDRSTSKISEWKDEANEVNRLVLEMAQDEDVLDTWFSSALWPFSTMGWPEETAELKTFYPGDVLCTAREIITLWVSRMVMMGQYCVGDIPFRDVYIHAMIQDGQGRKMSKSLGNGIDPLVAIDSHGADAMRFTLASMTTDTQDIRMPVEEMTLPDGRKVNTSPKFDIGRNFCNKLWNASRFAMMNLEGLDPSQFDKDKMAVEDKWILSRLAETIAEVTDSIDSFKFNEPMMSLYRFFWNDFCDWYLEWAKSAMQNEAQKPITQNILAFVLDQTLRLLHPFIPFITEGIFQRLNQIAPKRGLAGITEAKSSDALVAAQWPERIDQLIDADAEKEIEIVQAVIRTIRDIRNDRNISPKERLVVSVKSPTEEADVLGRNAQLVEHLAGLKEFIAGVEIERPANAAIGLADGIEVYVHDAIDPDTERQKLEKERDKVKKARAAVEGKLGNENFVNKAKPEVVAQARDKLGELSKQLETIEKHLGQLEG